MSNSIIAIILILSAAVQTLPGFCQQNRVSVTVTDIRSDIGLLRVALYDHPDQFPYEPGKSSAFEKSRMKDGILEIILIDIPPGIYAISILDDEDENNRMDYNILRIPKEGYGFSNNVKPGLRAPPFEKCSFPVQEGNTILQIEMQYFRGKT